MSRTKKRRRQRGYFQWVSERPWKAQADKQRHYWRYRNMLERQFRRRNKREIALGVEISARPKIKWFLIC